jgi:hypothetical protein
VTTITRWAAVVVAVVLLGTGVVLLRSGGDGAQLVVAGRGAGTIARACWLIGTLCAAYAACSWAWHRTRTAGLPGRTAGRAAAVLLSAGLVACALGTVALASLGGTVRYVDVGSASGHTVTVAEYRSLGGRQLQLGLRDGWSFRPASGARASANSNQVRPEPSPTGDDGFRLRVVGSRVLIDHGGRLPLEARLPG